MKRCLVPSVLIAVVWFATFVNSQNGASYAQALPQPADDEELPIGWEQPPIAAELPAASAATGKAIPPAVPTSAFLGVTFDPQTPKAAVVRSVAPGSPAEKAGLRAGDTIEALNDRLVTGYQDVLDAVRWMKPGDSVDLQVSRRVSLRTQAVLAPLSPSGQHTTNYRPVPAEPAPALEPQPTIAPEFLPEPDRLQPLERLQQRSRQPFRQSDADTSRLRILPFNADAQRPIRTNDGDTNRRSTDGQSQRNLSNEQEDDRRRGRFSRRRN